MLHCTARQCPSVSTLNTSIIQVFYRHKTTINTPYTVLVMISMILIRPHIQCQYVTMEIHTRMSNLKWW